MSLQFVGKTNLFLDTSKQESKKGELFFSKKKNEKENQKGESQKKNEKQIFKTLKKKQNTDKQNVKKSAQQKRKQIKLF